MTAGPVLADRVMKARRQSTCPLCRGPVHIGNLIARLGPGLWVHAHCLANRHHEDDPMQPFVIRSAHGNDLITIDVAGPVIALTVQARRPGEPVHITRDEARDLAAALLRRWPMIGEPTAAAHGATSP